MVAQSWPKSHESRPKVGPKSPVWDPSWTQKSTKNRPGPKKALPEMAPETIFIDFLRHLRSKSHSRSILGGSEPSKSCYFHSGSTIFTKSRFSLFPRFLLTPKWEPKTIYFSQKRARRDPKITKIAEKSSFLVDQNSSSNFGRKKTEKKRIGHLPWSQTQGGSAPWRTSVGG